jgi:gluconolactonase
MKTIERDVQSARSRRMFAALVLARRIRWEVALAGAVFALLVAACSGTSAAPSSGDSSAPAAATPTPAPTLRSLIAPGAKVKLFATGLEYAEGPLWLPDGRLIVSDVYGDAVLVFHATGHKSDFRRPSNVANGHALDADGSVVEAEAGDKTHHPLIARIAADGSATVLADKFRGKHFNEPNDLIVKSDGTIWFTDPSFDSDPSALGFYGVYRLDPKSKAVTLLNKTMGAPNGIAFSPDEKTLYVSDTASDAITAFPITANETLGRPNEQFGEGCDGIGVDEQGNVWATTCHLNVVITAPSGKRIGAISLPGSTSNLAWGGTDGKTLFVTTQEGDVYSLALTVRETR